MTRKGTWARGYGVGYLLFDLFDSSLLALICMETGTVKLPKALTNMSRMMMPAFVDVVEIYLDH